MNTVPRCLFTQAGYVFRGGNVYETDWCIASWGPDCGQWPLDAVPAYWLHIGEYLLGRDAGQEHVMYTLDRSGRNCVPQHSDAGSSSWIHWHALYDASTRLASVVDLERAEELKRAGSARDLAAQ